MSTAAGPLPISSPSRSRSRIHVHVIESHCIGIAPPAPSQCKRIVVWEIRGVGEFCHVCYENYLAVHWREIEIEKIIRLSDRESDFFKG